MRFFRVFILFCAVTAWTWAELPVDTQKTLEKYNLVFRIPEPEDFTPDYTALGVPGNTASGIPEKAASIEISARSTAEIQPTGRLILGKGKTGAEMLVSFFLSENNNADKVFIEEMAYLYITEAENEGINHDIAFAQMCLETGFLRFGGLVKPEMNNFCGLGSIGPEQPGLSFPSAQIGIRAHIQHLKAYATELPLNEELVDPRYNLVRRGTVPEVRGLAGTWAADRNYGEKIETILDRLYRFADAAPSIDFP